MKALIFDLDGTLLNTLGDLHCSTNFALKKFGYPERTIEEVNSFVGNGMGLLIRRALPSYADEETVQLVLKEMKAHYAEHFHDLTVPYDGIIELLKECKNRDIPMGIVSNKADPFVKKLAHVFFDGLIEIAIGETDMIPRKPAPDMVYHAMKRLNVQEAYYVGDSEVDVITAKNANLDCLSVTWGFRNAQQLADAGAKHLIYKPSEILKIIE